MEMKIPFYQVLNILLTGLVLATGIIICFPSELQSLFRDSKSLWNHSGFILPMVFIAGSYELGLIVNRLGSIVLEPTLVGLRIIPFDKNYRRYNDLKKQYPILEVLSREYASSRTNVVLFVALSSICFVAGPRIVGVCFLLGSVLFCLSWRKHAGKIVHLMRTTKDNSPEQQIS